VSFGKRNLDADRVVVVGATIATGFGTAAAGASVPALTATR